MKRFLCGSLKKTIVVTAATVFLCAVAFFISAPWLTRWYLQANHLADHDGYYLSNGFIIEQTGTLNEKSVQRFAEKVRTLIDTVLTNANAYYYAVVPEKGWFTAEQGWPTLDYYAMEAQLQHLLNGTATYIPIANTLSLEDYYYTDRHWRQEQLFPVVHALGDTMNFSISASEFTQTHNGSFRGAYPKSLHRFTASDTLTTLTSSILERVQVDNLQAPKLQSIYGFPTESSKESSYNFFLAGASPLIQIHSPHSRSERHLIIFRDSFASALAPLLCHEYRNITLVDLRYFSSVLLPDYLNADHCDILFLFSTAIINQSIMLR